MRRHAGIAVLIFLASVSHVSAQSNECYVVGTWNLEHFGFGKSRGFPEDKNGGPTYPAHTSEQRDAIARTIRDTLDAKILVLNEINGVRGGNYLLYKPNPRSYIGIRNGFQRVTAMSILSKKHFHDEDAAFAYLENLLWPDGPVCPHCGVIDNAGQLKGKSTRVGLWKCYACRKQFTVKVGTVFEHGRMPLHKMLQATYLMCSSKKGVSAHQLHRSLEITYKSAWFLAHRIREAMREGKLPGGMGGQNKVVEADETFIGGKAKNAHNSKPIPEKEIAFSLVERDGRVSSHHVPNVTKDTLRPILVTHINRKSWLMTDEAGQYIEVGGEFAGHGTVNHSIDEYVRHGGFMHTNTVESYFAILKRGIGGIYQHVGQQHLKRYLGEFDFRYNYRQALKYDDTARTEKALAGIVGKRLTYGGSGAQSHG
jgi:transposase-like protein